MKVRSYCLTFFTEPKHTLPVGFRYAIYGKEICPSTGKTHWQSYVELYNSQRMAYIKKAYEDKKVHCEPRMGTRDEARKYCMKDKEYIEVGRWISGPGHRSDLETVGQQLVNGNLSITELMEQCPQMYCQYRNGLKDLAAQGIKKKTSKFRELEVVFITGPTGCGKTRRAMEDAQYKIQGHQLGWWQDYQQEEIIVIDEYNNDIPITDLLSLLDGYQLRLNVKGTHTYANWGKVYITSNLKVDELHMNAKDSHRAALFRRITKIENLWGGQGGP